MNIDKAISIARRNRAALLKKKPSASPASGIGAERRITSCGCRAEVSASLDISRAETRILYLGQDCPM